MSVFGTKNKKLKKQKNKTTHGIISTGIKRSSDWKEKESFKDRNTRLFVPPKG